MSRDWRLGTGGSAGAGRVLVAGVGYRNLRDHSFGVVLSDRLGAQDLPANVSVEDLSFNPIAVVQRLEDDPTDSRFMRAIFVSALSRGRLPGTVTAYRWDGVLPSEEGVHQAICDAVTGVIHLDNTLIVARHLGALPADVVVIEVEPFAHEFGDTFSGPVADVFERVCARVVALATDGTEHRTLPQTPLGGADGMAPTDQAVRRL